MTGHFTWPKTYWLTLPMMKEEMAPLPRLPMMIMSMLLSSAREVMTRPGSPILTSAVSLVPTGICAFRLLKTSSGNEAVFIECDLQDRIGSVVHVSYVEKEEFRIVLDCHIKTDFESFFGSFRAINGDKDFLEFHSKHLRVKKVNMPLSYIIIP